MNAMVLIVYDDKSISTSITRNVSHRYQIETADNNEDGIALLKTRGPFDALLAGSSNHDNCIKLLVKAKEICPETPRILILQNKDFNEAMLSVNCGSVHKILTIPCPTETTIKAIDSAIELHKKTVQDHKLLINTLRGSIKVLFDVLNLVNPDAFNRGERIKRLLMANVKRLSLQNPLKYELAGMLSQIGLISVPHEIVEKKLTGLALSPEDNQIFKMHAAVATTLLSQIPKLSDVIEIVGNQLECKSDLDISKLSDGSALLNMCTFYDDMMQTETNKETINNFIKNKWGTAFPHLVNCFEEIIFSDDGYIPRTIPLKNILIGMVLQQNIVDSRGLLIMAKGQEVTEQTIIKLVSLNKELALPKEIKVLIPLH